MPNGLGAVGIGLGQAGKDFYKGQEAGENRQMAREQAAQKNQLMQMQMQQMQYQQSMQKTPEQIAAEQENLRLQTENMRNQQAKLHSYDAFKKYNVDSNVRHINQMIQTNPVLKEMFPNFVRANRLNTTDEADRILAQQNGINPDMLPEYDPANPDNTYQRFIKGTLNDGSEVLLDMQHIQEKMGYMDYLDDQELDRQIKRSQASKSSGLDPLKQLKLQEELDIKAAQKDELAFKDELKTITADEFNAKKGTETYKKVEEAYQRAKKLQPMDRKPTGPTADNLKQKSAIIPSFMALQDKLNRLKLDKNALNKMHNAFSKLAGSDFTGKDLRTFQNELGFMGELNTVVAQYVKDMSGAAVTEQERAMYADIIQGGTWATKEAMTASLGGFIRGIKGLFENSVDSMSDEFPRTAFETMRNYKRKIAKYGLVEKPEEVFAKPSVIKEEGTTIPEQGKSLDSDKTTAQAFLKTMQAKMSNNEKPTPEETAKYKEYKAAGLFD